MAVAFFVENPCPSRAQTDSSSSARPPPTPSKKIIS